MNNLLINYEMPKQKKLHDDVLKERNIEGLRIKEYHNGNFIEKSNLEDIYKDLWKGANDCLRQEASVLSDIGAMAKWLKNFRVDPYR